MSPAMMQREALGVIGAGRWGITLAHAAARCGRPVWLHAADKRLATRLQTRRLARSVVPELDALHAGVTVSADLQQVCAHSDVLLLACGASEVRALARSLGGHIDAAHKVVHAVRGREPDSLKAPSSVIREETCAMQVGALLGPILAESLLADLPGAAVVASPFPAVVKALQIRLASDNLRIYASDDLDGVETAAAASSVLAIGVGVCLELELGPATLATLMVRGLAEMSRVVAAAGGRAETAFGLAGMGDLIVRRECDSREVRAGRMLAQGADMKAIVARLGELDAVAAARTFCQLAGVAAVEARIATTIDALTHGDIDGRAAVQQLMGLAQMTE